MIGGVADGDRAAQLIAFADPDAELELVIQAAARTIFRNIGIGWLALPCGRITGSPEARTELARP